jgi:hypothetical protein
MPIIDALKILQSGRVLRASIELDEALLSLKISYDGKRRITVDLDELSLDEPMTMELTELGRDEVEKQPDDFPDQ